jgi:UPF0271 protein
VIVVERFGDAGLRARLPEGADARAILAALRAQPGVVDAVVTEHHALVAFEPGTAPPPLRDAIAAALAAPAPAPPRTHVVAVRYGGPDLDEVARAARMAPADVVALHAGAEYEAVTIGFLPGFAYLRGLDPRLVLPRRASPRARVPALSVAVAGPYTGVYPFTSPGGWNLIGTALGFTPFDAQTGAAIGLGDRVRFVASGP